MPTVSLLVLELNEECLLSYLLLVSDISKLGIERLLAANLLLTKISTSEMSLRGPNRLQL